MGEDRRFAFNLLTLEIVLPSTLTFGELGSDRFSKVVGRRSGVVVGDRNRELGNCMVAGREGNVREVVYPTVDGGSDVGVSPEFPAVQGRLGLCLRDVGFDVSRSFAKSFNVRLRDSLRA